MPVAIYTIGKVKKDSKEFLFHFGFQNFNYRRLRKLIKKKHGLDCRIHIKRVRRKINQ